MNSEEKPCRWGKQKEERKSNRFLKRNGDNGRRRALIFLLFSSLPLPLPSLLWITAQGVGGTGRGEEIRVWRGGVL